MVTDNKNERLFIHSSIIFFVVIFILKPTAGLYLRGDTEGRGGNTIKNLLHVYFVQTESSHICLLSSFEDNLKIQFHPDSDIKRLKSKRCFILKSLTNLLLVLLIRSNAPYWPTGLWHKQRYYTLPYCTDET